MSTADDPAYEMTFGSTSEPVVVPRWDAMEALHQQIQLLEDRVNRLVESRESMSILLTTADRNYAELNERLRESAKVVAAQQEEIERLRLREALRSEGVNWRE